MARLQDPKTAEYMDKMYAIAGLRRGDVIDTPTAPRQQQAGPVLGY